MNKRIIGFGILGVAAMAVLLSTTVTSCLNPELKELNPCLVSGVVDQVNIDKVDSVDLMFIIDKSQSMIQEQKKIRDQFGRLIQVLTSGDKDPKDGIIEGKDFMPAKSLHLAVVSSDLGLPVITAAGELPDASCRGLGDDGVFQNQPHAVIEGQTDSTVSPLQCQKSYPAFLDYTAKGGNVAAITTDFQCIAGIGPYGCGFEQQLEAGLKALWPATPSAKVLDAYNTLVSGTNAKPISFLATQGHGDSPSHADFLRGTDYYIRNHPDQQGKLSLLAVVAVSDENDCSMGANGNMDMLKKAPAGLTPEQVKNLNLRCYYDSLISSPNRYPVERYAAGFKALRGKGKEYLTIFGAIVGVPTNIIRNEADLDFDKDTEITDAERAAYFQSILDDPSMQEREDPNAPGYLQSACVLEKPAGEYDPTAPDGSEKAEKYVTDAQPGRRFVEVARQFGPNGVVRSICEENFSGAIDQIIEAVSKQLGGVCLKRQLNRDADNKVACDITWDMPDGINCDHPDHAAYLEFPKPGERSRTDDGRPVCTVKQIPVTNPALGKGVKAGAFLDALDRNATGGVGWYYDDFSNTIEKDCKLQKQRVAFVLSPGDQPVQDPPAGVTVNLVCLNEMNALLTGNSNQGKKIGDKCSDLEGEECTEGNHLCHPQNKVCVQTCTSTSQCPPAWVCDKRRSTVEDTTVNGVPLKGTGTPICVNPTCGN